MHVDSCSQIFGRFPTNKNYRPPLQQVSPAEQNRILFGRLAHLELQKWKSMKSFAKWNELGWPVTFQHWGSEGFGEMNFRRMKPGLFQYSIIFLWPKARKWRLQDVNALHSLHVWVVCCCELCSQKSARITFNPVWNVPDISKNDSLRPSSASAVGCRVGEM